MIESGRKLSYRAVCSLLLASALSSGVPVAQAGVVGTVGASVQISKDNAFPSLPVLDTQERRSFVGNESVQAGVSLLWPVPADIAEVRGQFNGVARASADTRTLELHALAAAGGNKIATEDSAGASASVSLRFGITGPSGVTFPARFKFSMDGGVEATPLPDETRSLGLGLLDVRVDGLSGAAGSSIDTFSRTQIVRSTDPRQDSGTSLLVVDTVFETGRAFTMDMTLIARASFNAVADFSNTARLDEIVMPLGFDLVLDGVQLERHGTSYTILGQAAPVPEPAGFSLLALGLAVLVWARRGAVGSASGSAA